MNQHIYTLTRHVGFALLLLTAMAACRVPKKSLSPAPLDLPETYRSVPSSPATAAVDTMGWRSYFKDPDLRKLLDSAMLRNNNLQIAVLNIERAQLGLKQAKWGHVPELNLAISASSSRPSENSFTGFNMNQALGQSHMEDYNLQLGMTWEADLWGKIKKTKQLALAGLWQTEAYRKVVQTSVVNLVANGFFNLLMLDYQLDIARQNVLLSDSVLRMVEVQFQSAQVTALAVEQARAQRLEAAQLIPLIEQQVHQQENALSVLAGSFPQKQQRQVGLSDLSLSANPALGVPAELLANRPDVKAAELAVQMANAQVGIQRANFYPSLRITAQAGLNAFELSNWFTMPASIFGNILGGLSQPLLNNRKIKTAYQQSLLEREQLILTFRDKVLLAVSEVSDAYVSINKLAAQQEFLEARVQSLRSATNKARLLFQSGMANYLEVITAQGSLLNSELALANNKRALLRAHLSLYTALGGGWME